MSLSKKAFALMNPAAAHKLLKRFAKKVRKAGKELLLSPGKILAEGSKCLRLTEEHLARHVFIAGGSGQGKSKLLEMAMRQMIDQGKGFTFIDPHGDTAQALLDYCVATGVDPEDVVYLKPGIDHCFSLDPLAGAPDGRNLLELEHWIDSTADTLIDGLLRNSAAADQEMMKRLKHRMKNLIWFCAVRVNGKHLGLADMQALIDPSRPEFGALMDRVGPVLQRIKPDVYHEFEQVRNTKSDSLRNQWIESTNNLLSGVMGAITQLIFGQHAESINPKEFLRKRKIVLVDLGRESGGTSKGISRAQGNIVGGLIISALIAAARETPEEERVDHALIIDEAENYIGEDLRMAFAEMRKFRLQVVIALQDLSCLRKGDLDLVERVLSICGLWFIFRQQDKENLEYLGPCLKYGSLDMTPLLSKSVLPGGYEWVDTLAWNVSVSQTRSESVAHSASVNRSVSQTHSTSESIQASVSASVSNSETNTDGQSKTLTRGSGGSIGVTHTESNQEGVSNGRTQNEQEMTSLARNSQEGNSVSFTPGGPIHGRSAGNSRVEGAGKARGSGTTDTVSRTEGAADGLSQGLTWQEGEAIARNKGLALARAVSLGLSLAKGLSVSKSDAVSTGTALALTKGETRGDGMTLGMTKGKTPLAKHVIEEKPHGKLIVSVQDQIAKVINTLASLPPRTVLVKAQDVKTPFMPFLLEVHEVKDAYEAAGRAVSLADRARLKREYLAEVRKAPHYFTPTDAEHRGRITRFLRESGATLSRDRRDAATLSSPTAFEPDEENPIA